MGRMWKNKPNQATAVALGTNVLNYVANKSPKAAIATALIQPLALRMIASAEIKDQKAENAAKSFGNVAKTFIKNNPISSAITAGVLAIGAAQAIKSRSQTAENTESKVENTDNADKTAQA